LNVKLRVAEKYPISNFHQKHAARREMKEKRKMFVAKQNQIGSTMAMEWRKNSPHNICIEPDGSESKFHWKRKQQHAHTHKNGFEQTIESSSGRSVSSGRHGDNVVERNHNWVGSSPWQLLIITYNSHCTSSNS